MGGKAWDLARTECSTVFEYEVRCFYSFFFVFVTLLFHSFPSKMGPERRRSTPQLDPFISFENRSQI